MLRTVRPGYVLLSIALTLRSAALVSAQEVAVPSPRMNVVAVEGEAAIHDMRHRKTSDVVVLVRDGNRKPIARASVVFTLPAEGASATLPNNTKTIAATSNAEGYAVARGIRPNNIPGPFKIHVEAQHQGETATVEITQFNMSVERSKGGSGKWIALVGAIGAAAAGGMVAAQRNGGGNSTPAAAPSPPIGIAPGPATVGPPR
jgi:hypothetical protein